jgi:hypothetical protein
MDNTTFVTVTILTWIVSLFLGVWLFWAVIATAFATRRTAKATEELVSQVAEIKAQLAAKGE